MKGDWHDLHHIKLKKVGIIKHNLLVDKHTDYMLQIILTLLLS